MAESVEQSVGTSLTTYLTQDQFEALLKNDVSKWLKAFLSNFPFEDVMRDGCWGNEKKLIEIEDVQEYEGFDAEQNVLGFHIKHVETEGGEYDQSDLTEVFAIFKDGKFLLHFGIDGTYNSYEYNNYDDDAYEVEKREVKVMQWLPKEK